MEIVKVDPLVTAFIRPKDGANVGLIHTSEGNILIDTTSSPGEIQALLDAAQMRVEEIRLVINTHHHSDHTWGNQVFSCPILAHRLCREKMQSALDNEWSEETLNGYIADLEKTDPPKAEQVRQVVRGLHIKLPDKVFDDRYEGDLGGIKVEVIHMGGHTADTAIVWMPENRLLYASDLVFQGRYPYIFDADIPAWIEALDRLLEYDAQTIIPGHGVLCGEQEIFTLRDYLQGTYRLAQEHIRQGHSVEQAEADPAFPVFPGEKYERLHKANIRHVYGVLSEQAALG